MANGLTSLNSYIAENDFRHISNMKSKFENLENKTPKTFKDLLVDKGANKGKVDPKKLDSDDKKLYNSCVEMESFLWKQVLNSMKQTINKTKLIDGGQTEEIFTDFLYDEYSTMMAKNANGNITDTLFRELSHYK